MVLDAETHRWLNEKSAETRRAYLHELFRVSTILRKPLREITAADLPRFRQSLQPLSLPTQRRTVAAMKSYLGHLADSGAELALASRQLHLPKMKTRQKQRLTRTDLQQLVAGEPDARNRLLLQLLYEAAARVSEITQLHWRDVQGDALTGAIMLRGPKTRRGREMPLSPKVWQALHALRGEAGNDEPIFRSQKGGPLTTSQIFRVVQAAGRRAQLPALSPHGLRQTHISHALQAGAPLQLVSRQLGYKSVGAVAQYLPPVSDQSTLSYLTASTGGAE